MTKLKDLCNWEQESIRNINVKPWHILLDFELIFALLLSK